MRVSDLFLSMLLAQQVALHVTESISMKAFRPGRLIAAGVREESGPSKLEPDMLAEVRIGSERPVSMYDLVGELRP